VRFNLAVSTAQELVTTMADYPFDLRASRWSTLPDLPLRPRLSAAVAGGDDGDASLVFVWAGSDDANLPFVDRAMLRLPGRPTRR
jgi:hypothetical protein